LPPVITSFPEPKQGDDLGVVESVDETGNCSGSYSMFSRPSPMAIAFRLRFGPDRPR